MSYSLEKKVVTIFGGTGFIGRHIVSQMAMSGSVLGPRIKIPSRRGQSAYFLRQYGVVGQIVPVPCNYSQEEIDQAVAGSDVVVNCTGILIEKGKSTFQRVHVETASQIANACAKHGIKRLVHVSALGIDESKSEYARSKRDGEAAIRAAFPAATILRPSVVFGAEDKFFNKFAQLSLFLPALPLIAGGKSRFQPVYVGDVAQAVINAIRGPEFGNDTTLGKTYELGGPEVLNFGQIYQKIFAQTGRKRFVFNLPESFARMQAGMFSLLPNPPLTNDQITSLKSDNIVTEGGLTLQSLGIQPTAVDAVLPLYLDHYREGGKNAERKRA